MENPKQRLFNDIRAMAIRIWNDITHLRNIEKYVVSVLAIYYAIAGLGVVDIPNEHKISVGLATLGLLVFNLTRPDSEKSGKHLDDYLNDRNDLPALREILKSTEEFWIYAPSGANLLRGDLLGIIKENILKKEKGRLRVMLQNPNKKEAIEILVEHLDKGVVEQNNQNMSEEINQTKQLLEQISKDQKHYNGKLEYGFINYGLGFSILAFNPNREHGYLILEIHGFLNKDTRGRMHIVIKRRESERWYSYWKNQMISMWEKAENKVESKS